MPRRPTISVVAYVIVRFKGEETHRLELAGPITIGRDLSCHVWIGDPKLSRYHCQIAPDEKGRWIVKDLDSRNGIYLHDQRMKQFGARDGEAFKIGQAEVTFYAGAPPTKRPRTPNETLHESLMTPMAKVENGREAHARMATNVRPTAGTIAPKQVRLVAREDEPLVKPYALPFQRPRPRVIRPGSPAPAKTQVETSEPQPIPPQGMLGSMLRSLRLI